MPTVVLKLFAGQGTVTDGRTMGKIRSGNQSVLSNEGKVFFSRKQQEPLMGLELMTDKMRYPLHHPFKGLTILLPP